MTLQEVWNKLDDEYKRLDNDSNIGNSWDKGYGRGGADAILRCQMILRMALNSNEFFEDLGFRHDCRERKIVKRNQLV